MRDNTKRKIMIAGAMVEGIDDRERKATIMRRLAADKLCSERTVRRWVQYYKDSKAAH